MAHLTPKGIGIDHCEVERLRATVERTPRFVDRCFTAAEQADCQRKPDTVASLAARWAGKEAVMKSLGVGLGDVALTDIEIVSADGPPSVSVRGAAARIADDRGVTAWLVSITHTASLATAMVTALGPFVDAGGSLQ